MALPTSNDVRLVDPVLTNLSIGFKNERFLWPMIAPVSEQEQASGTVPIYTRDYWFRRQTGARRAAAGPYTRTGWGISSTTYDAIERGFERPLDDPTRAKSQLPEDMQITDVRFLTNLMELEMEKDVAAAAFITGVWGTSTTLSGGDQWSDYANSDPIANADTAIRTIKRNTGARVNTMFVGLLGWEKLKEHPLILDKYKHTQKAIMTEAMVADVLGVGELIVGDSVENSAAEGQDFTGADIWTDNALFLVRNAPQLGVANGAYTFVWNEKGNVPWAIETYRDETVRSEVTRIFTHYDIKIVSSQHGYIYLDSVA